jgi:hypothetical protein
MALPLEASILLEFTLKKLAAMALMANNNTMPFL